MIVVEADCLSKSFATRKKPSDNVLSEVSLSISAGEMVAIVGPSGSGKSTLLHCLAGLEPISSGRVELVGEDMGAMGRGRLARLRRDHVGFVFQSYNLIPSLSAFENVALPSRLRKQKVSRSDVREMLLKVGLETRANGLPNELSGGQQQRVALARVLVSLPSVIFADEPTGALDTVTGQDVLIMLREATLKGSSVVLVTHDLEAASRADRVFVLRDGTIHAELLSPAPNEILDALVSAGRGVDANR